MTLPTETMPPARAGSFALPAQEVESRILELRAEAQAQSDRTLKAALLYEIAHLEETALQSSARAVQDYLAAYNADSRMRLPLYALLRMFERKRSHKNLQRLYDAELRSARTPEEKAAALIDQGVLTMVTTQDVEAARARFEQAVEHNKNAADALLLLEWNRRAVKDEASAEQVLVRRAEACDDPVLQGVLLLELANIREQAGDVGSALSALKQAALGVAQHEGFLIALERFARRHGYFQELVDATEKHAELLSSELNERLLDDPRDEALIEDLRGRAFALFYDAARLKCGPLGDPQGALSCLERAAAIQSEEVLLCQTRMLAHDMLEDRERSAREAERLLAEGISGEHAAALHFRLAENALVQGDSETARTSLMEAIAQAGGSVAADAMLDDLLLDEERHRERIERREARAATADAARASRWLLEAALIAAHELRDVEQSSALFERAANKAKGNADLLREAYGAALDVGDEATARLAIDGLLATPLDEDEWQALLAHRIELANGGAKDLLQLHLEDPRASQVVADLARQRAAEDRDYELLSRAHETLARSVAKVEHGVAHLCAAARAAFRGGANERAESLLRTALERSPGNRYALTLLEEALRARGENDQVVALLKRAAEAQNNAEDAELSLLLAGAAAEGAGDKDAAAHTYEEAADRNPASVGPLWALLRLAERTGDNALELKAREGLAAREQALGQASIESLFLAEHYDRVSDKPELADALLLAALEDPSVGHHAAAALLMARGVGTEAARRALEVLRARSGQNGEPGFLRALGDDVFAREGLTAQASGLIEELLAIRPGDRWALFAKSTDFTEADPASYAANLEALAAQTTCPSIKDASLAGALHARLLTGELERLDSLEPQGMGAAVARTVRDVAGPAHKTLRAHALAIHKDQLKGDNQAEERLDTLHALTRSLLHAGDAKGAFEAANELVAYDQNDLAALELLRVAARRSGNMRELAIACERLAEHVDGELWAQLLEESAAARMDFLGDEEGALKVLQHVRAKFPARPITYGRMHDLIAERGDTEELLALVQDRTEQIDDPTELARLFYELARLHRGAGDFDSALASLDNLSMLEDHVGGIALAVEIHSAREAWPEAVEALQQLAENDEVPRAQRRLARLGAADFLENRLGDVNGALSELGKLDAEGHGDLPLYLRTADVADRAGRPDRSADALKKAAELARGDQRIEVLMRLANVCATKLGKPAEAENAFERVLEQRPGHAEAARGFAAFTRDPAKKEKVIARFESDVRAECDTDPGNPDALRKLITLSELRAAPDIAFVALSTLSAIGAANVGERDQTDTALRKMLGTRIDAASPIDAATLRGLLVPQLDEKYLALTNLIFSAAHELDQLEPGRFGVGRGQRVSPRETNQVRDEVNAMMLALAIKPSDFYVGGDEPGRALALPRENECAFVIGVGVTAPLTMARRQQVALQIAAVHLNALPLLSRSSLEATRLVAAALVAADCPLPTGITREELADLPKLVGKAMPRRVRKAIPDIVRSVPDGGARLERHLRELLRHTRRLALLLGGDLGTSLELALGRAPDRDAVLGSDDALDLVRAWTSAPMATLRRKVGLVR